MSQHWQSATRLARALAGLAPVLAGCAPERDVVATELQQAGSGGAAVGGSGGSAGAPISSPTPCQSLLEGGGAALSLFEFENVQGQSEVPDRFGGRSLSVVGSPASALQGPEGCGSALAFGSDERYLLLGDEATWNLTQGSIDAWFYVPETVPDVMGIVSRDRYGDDVGHFSVFLLSDRTIVARLQQSVVGAMPTVLALSCSTAPLPASTWAHFGFNFGPGGAALFVNGALAMGTGEPGVEIGMVSCGSSAPSPTIPDLNLPWVIGASIYASMDPPNVREFPFLNGAIDNLRISAVERDFAAAF